MTSPKPSRNIPRAIALALLGWRRPAKPTPQPQTDPLTGCLHRHALAQHTDRLLAQTAPQGQSLAFVMIDINNFKQINDRSGHAAGDAILADLATRLRALAPSSALIARLGGDEFACILPFSPGQRDTIDRLAAQITATLGHPITASVGIAQSDPATPIDSATLLHRADIALYQAKQHSPATALWFDPSMESALRYRCELETAMRAAIPRGEFVPYYEQQIDLSTGELRGFEMLARWHSPIFGLVTPDVFIPIAEETGLIAPLSESLIVQALRDAREWDGALTLSVNISPIQLRDPWFAQKLLKLLVEANFPAPRLDIEITESGLHTNVAMVQSLITSLRNQGIAVSLDDFGTGYSSLAQLRKLSFDRIKIDRSFVSAMASDADSRTIVEVIVALGRGLNLPITAEGIENEALLAALRALGDFKGQGYLYGQPQSAAATHRFLAERNLLTTEPPAPFQRLTA